MDIDVRQYYIPPTDLIPNSPRPLLHCKNVLPKKQNASHCDPIEVWRLFTKNGWDVHWIYRYGPTQQSHYHSKAHECMAVLSGTASIRFGVADAVSDTAENSRDSARETGGVLLEAEAGDVFIIPAGVAHKTHNTKPEAEFALLSPGTGHGIACEDPVRALSEIRLDGFTMMGAYSGGDWDFVAAGGVFEHAWAVPKPQCDPVFGTGERGLCKTWCGSNATPKARL